MIAHGPNTGPQLQIQWTNTGQMNTESFGGETTNLTIPDCFSTYKSLEVTVWSGKSCITPLCVCVCAWERMCSWVVKMLAFACVWAHSLKIVFCLHVHKSACMCEQQLITTSYCRSLLSCVLLCYLPKFVATVTPLPPPDRNPGPLALWLDIRGLSISVSNTH